MALRAIKGDETSRQKRTMRDRSGNFQGSVPGQLLYPNQIRPRKALPDRSLTVAGL